MKSFFKKVWIFIRTYWYILVGALAVLLAILLGRKDSVRDIFDLVKKERDLGKKEVAIITETHRQKKEELKRNAEKSALSVTEFKREEKEAAVLLARKKASQEADLAARINENPSRAVSEIAKEMGWDYES